MVIDIVEGQRRGGGPKNGQNSSWGKNIVKTRGPKMAKMQHGVKPDIFKYATALGQEQSEAGASLEEALKKAKTEVPESRDTTTSRPPEASLAEANAKIARLEGSLAALGRDDIAERRVLEDALAKVRARAIVAPVGQRLDEYKKYCEGATKRLEKAQEVVCEALKVTQREEELAEGKRRLEALQSEAAAQPVPFRSSQSQGPTS